MKSIYNFLKTTILGGVFFLLPLILVILIMSKAFEAVSKALNPLAKVLPFPSFLGVPTPYLGAALIFIFIGFFAGLLAKTKIGGHFRQSVEKKLDRIPGYSILRVFAQEAEGAEGAQPSPVALLNWGNDNWQWCFIVERHASGYVTVFIPSAPKPTSGAVRLLPASQVKEVDVSMTLAIKCLTNSGVGSLSLLHKVLGS